MGGKPSRRIVSSSTLGLVLDGASVLPLPPFLLPPTTQPLTSDTLSVEPWRCGSTAASNLLAWLGDSFPHRPLLGLTPRPFSDPEGAPIRGLSVLGSGVALVSTRNLTETSLAGVIRHELGHAFGMDHCEHWECALSQRPNSLPVRDRPSAFCPACQGYWDALFPGEKS